ncbi:MAG: MFS transporter [Gaiellaceae bacterium]
MRSLPPRSALWRDRGFVSLWAANGVSQLGTQVTLLALPLAALYVLNAGTLAVALLRSFAILPFLLFSLPAGVWIDRLRRRPLMVAADVGRALAIASIPVAYWLGHLTLVQLYVVAGVHGLLSVVFDVSYLSFLPTLVGRPHLGEANAKLLGTQSLAQLAGPTLAGGLVSAVGAPVAVLADAASFAVSGIFVTTIRGREPKPEASATRARTELLEGLRYVFSQPYLRILTLTFSAMNLFTSALFALLIVYFVRDLHLRAATIGWVMAVVNLGFVAGAFANGPLVRRFGIGPMIAYASVLSPLSLLTIPAAPLSHPLPVLLMGGVAGTFIGFFSNVNQLTLRQSITPVRLLGRMNSVARFMYWGTMPLGSALGGVLAQEIGLRTTLFIAAGGAAVAALPVGLSPIRRLRDLPEPPPEPALSVEPLGA